MVGSQKILPLNISLQEAGVKLHKDYDEGHAENLLGGNKLKKF